MVEWRAKVTQYFRQTGGFDSKDLHQDEGFALLNQLEDGATLTMWKKLNSKAALQDFMRTVKWKRKIKQIHATVLNVLRVIYGEQALQGDPGTNSTTQTELLEHIRRMSRNLDAQQPNYSLTQTATHQSIVADKKEEDSETVEVGPGQSLSSKTVRSVEEMGVSINSAIATVNQSIGDWLEHRKRLKATAEGFLGRNNELTKKLLLARRELQKERNCTAQRKIDLSNEKKRKLQLQAELNAALVMVNEAAAREKDLMKGQQSQETSHEKQASAQSIVAQMIQGTWKPPQKRSAPPPSNSGRMANSDPMIKACKAGDTEQVQRLISENGGKSAASQRSYVRRQDKAGSDAIIHATWNNNIDVIRLLIRHGANTSCSNNLGNTALHFACQRGHLELVRLLAEHGARGMGKNASKQTPLDLLPNGVGDRHELVFLLDCAEKKWQMALTSLSKSKKRKGKKVRSRASNVNENLSGSQTTRKPKLAGTREYPGNPYLSTTGKSSRNSGPTAKIRRPGTSHAATRPLLIAPFASRVQSARRDPRAVNSYMVTAKQN